ncbi:hypothetical protein ZHAS_00019128 [Anopheles sinensis]|uniref:Uncharacterized protein n=1 Tax=Anopheles sinensis TaxID=74873 RepID=A0A084WLH9_ANOSI|nr:hypothetical protein ZHAS_00019128 [Anopheles sinensis]
MSLVCPETKSGQTEPRGMGQQAEIPRTYVKAPPNKTVRDVPVQYQSTGAITAHGTSTILSSLAAASSPIAGDGTASVYLRGGASSVTSASNITTVGASIGSTATYHYYGGSGTIPRPIDTNHRLSASSAGNSLSLASSAGSSGAAAGKSDKLQKIGQILRLFPGNKTSKATSVSVVAAGGNGVGVSGPRAEGRASTGLSLATGAGIHNHNQHYRSSGVAAVVAAVSSGPAGSLPLATSPLGASPSSSSCSSSSSMTSSSSASLPSSATVQQRLQSGTEPPSAGGPTSLPTTTTTNTGACPSLPVAASVSPSPDPHAHYM